VDDEIKKAAGELKEDGKFLKITIIKHKSLFQNNYQADETLLEHM